MKQNLIQAHEFLDKHVMHTVLNMRHSLATGINVHKLPVGVIKVCMCGYTTYNFSGTICQVTKECGNKMVESIWCFLATEWRSRFEKYLKYKGVPIPVLPYRGIDYLYINTLKDEPYFIK